MADLEFSLMSTPSATRDVAIDFTEALESGELIEATPTVTSADTDVLTVSDPAPNSAQIVDGNITIEIGKGVTFSIETVSTVSVIGIVYVNFVGNSGTSETYEIKVPLIAPALTS